MGASQIAVWRHCYLAQTMHNSWRVIHLLNPECVFFVMNYQQDLWRRLAASFLIAPANQAAWEAPGQWGTSWEHCQPALCCWLIICDSASPCVPPITTNARHPVSNYINQVWLSALPVPANELWQVGDGYELQAWKSCRPPCFPGSTLQRGSNQNPHNLPKCLESRDLGAYLPATPKEGWSLGIYVVVVFFFCLFVYSCHDAKINRISKNSISSRYSDTLKHLPFDSAICSFAGIWYWGSQR